MRSTSFLATHPVFTHEEYLAAYLAERQRSQRTADTLLYRHATAGRLLRIRRGLYGVVPEGSDRTFKADPYLLASKLAPDAAIAYHAALQFRGKAYSVWHRFTVLSRLHVRPLNFQGNEFACVQPPLVLRKRRDLGGGIVSEPYAGGEVRVTTLERTLLDVLDQPELGGGWEEIWRSLEMVEYFDLDAVVEHTLRRGSALTTARVGLFLDLHREALFVEERHLKPLKRRVPRGPRYLDLTKERGRLVKPWNLIVPERVLNRTWEEIG